LIGIKRRLAKKLSETVEIDSAEIEAALTLAPDIKQGDLALPCFMFSKKKKAPPQKIAQQIASSFKKDNFFVDIEVKGPYVNFFFNREEFAKTIFNQIENIENWFEVEKEKKIYVIDYSSPNVAKPFSIGHLRSTVIGYSLKKILEYDGHVVIGINHLGDWGTQFGKLLYAYEKWANKDQNLTIKDLLNLYVKFHEEEERFPELREIARQKFASIENGDKYAVGVWEKFRDISFEHLDRIYKRLGIKFKLYKEDASGDNFYIGESYYTQFLEDTFERISQKGVVEEDNGALIVRFDEDIPPCLLKKSDGTTLYATRDLASMFFRKEKLKADYLLYVVGVEQTLHFKQLKLLLKKAGYDWYKNIEHISFGHYRFKDVKMSTRKGNVIFMEEVFDKAVKLVSELIEEKNPGLENKEEVSEMVGLGAVIFGDLVNDRVKDIDFDWKKITSFEGETGPYVQYTHARINSILSKANFKNNNGIIDYRLFCEMPEYELVFELSLFPLAFAKAMRDYKPSHIARYVLNLSKKFNSFYHKCSVLNAKTDNLKACRLKLIKAIKNVIQTCLDLLNIKAPSRM